MKMKKFLCYLADILTFSRILLSIFLIIWGFVGGAIWVGFVIFVIAELTDAFDGTCSRKWPFKKDHEPKYRKWAVKYDMLADSLLWFASVMFLALRISALLGYLLLGVTVVVCGVIELIVYGKFFGHPDDCKKNSLCARDFKTAKQLVMIRRWYYLFTIILVAVDTLLMSELSRGVQYILIAVGVLVLVFLWFFLATRRKNISRNAIDLEQKMLKK